MRTSTALVVASIVMICLLGVSTPAVVQVEPHDAAPVKIMDRQWSVQPPTPLRRYTESENALSRAPQGRAIRAGSVSSIGIRHSSGVGMTGRVSGFMASESRGPLIKSAPRATGFFRDELLGAKRGQARAA